MKRFKKVSSDLKTILKPDLPTLVADLWFHELRERKNTSINLKSRANGRNIVGCYMLRPFAHPVACCWMLLRVVAESLKPVKLFSQELEA